MSSFRTRHAVPFTARQMFDLVADVEKYPLFLPLCEALTVKKREQQDGKAALIAEMTVGYHAIRETFTSRVTLDEERLAVVAETVPDYASGPFRQLENRWSFLPTPEGCEVDFFIAYEFKSTLLQMLVGGLFERVFRRYTGAFEERAHAVYGPPAGTPSA